MNEVRTSGPLSFTEPDCPTRVGERINTLNEIYDIPMPRLGMRVFVKDEGLSYIITGLKDKTIEGVVVPDAQVDKYESIGAKDIAWDSSSNLNDFINAGVYNIKGTRQNAADNLPITNTGADATIAARLIVTVTPEGATTYRHSIGQTLILSNAEGKETKIYTRNGNRTSYDGGASYTIEWGAWATQQTNVNVGQVDNLNNLTDNGIYSGVWNMSGNPLTFVCITINDYALGINPRRVSQFVYGLSKADGSVSYKTRTGEGDTTITWGAWKDINEDSIQEIRDWINTEMQNLGEYISQVQESVNKTNTDLTETKKNIVSSLHVSGIADSVNITGKSDVGKTTFSVNIPAATQTTAGVMTAEDKKAVDGIADAVHTLATDIETERNARTNAVSDIKKYALQYDTLGFSPTADKLNVSAKTLDGQGTLDGYIPAATTEKAGVMTAKDKKAVDGIADAVEEGRKAALRALYIAAGATYNNTGEDKAKTPLFGEMVIHKAGCYYLNKLGDITEDEMLAIYDKRDAVLYFAYGRGLMGFQGRTIFPAQMTGSARDSFFENSINGFSLCTNSNIEIFYPYGDVYASTITTGQMLKFKTLASTFSNCQKLKHVVTINASEVQSTTNAFSKCYALNTVFLYGLKMNINFSDSFLLSKESLLYIIQNSAATSPITITLHPDVYALFAEDTDIISALEAKPLVTLASA